MTVVLCGSLGLSAEVWERQAAVLEGHEPVFVEHPGHGGAPVGNVRDVGDLAVRVLDAADGSFTFVGLSLGGAVGMRLALDVPERLDRLVLVCTSRRFGEPAQWTERAATVRAQGLEAIVDPVLERWFTPSFADLARYRARFLATEPEGYARCCEALATWDVREALGAVRAPTLVVAAEDDPSAPPAEAEQIAASIPGARLEVIPGAKHLAPVEFAGAFNRLLEGLL
ncbi:MAG TPA: alpha/beta fold hydrolase [Gaiellaceae bacterium]|nr:alpha/beta fold hydrolase [Gaiellaceae bacterium]